MALHTPTMPMTAEELRLIRHNAHVGRGPRRSDESHDFHQYALEAQDIEYLRASGLFAVPEADEDDNRFIWAE